MVPYFQNMIEWMTVTWGYTPYFILGSNIFFLAVIHLFDFTDLPKWFNHSEIPSKMINYGPRVQRLRDISGTLYKSQADVYTY